MPAPNTFAELISLYCKRARRYAVYVVEQREVGQEVNPHVQNELALMVMSLTEYIEQNVPPTDNEPDLPTDLFIACMKTDGNYRFKGDVNDVVTIFIDHDELEQLDPDARREQVMSLLSQLAAIENPEADEMMALLELDYLGGTKAAVARYYSNE